MLELAPALLLALVPLASLAQAPSPGVPAVQPPEDEREDPVESALTVSSAGLAALVADPRDAGLARLLALAEERLGQQAARDEGARGLHSIWRLLQHGFVVRAGALPADVAGTEGAGQHPWLQLTSFPADRTVARASTARLRAELLRRGLELETAGGAHRARTPRGELRFGVRGEGDQAGFFASLGTYLPEPEEPDRALHLRWDGAACAALLSQALESASGGPAGDESARSVVAWLERRGLLGEGSGGTLDLRLEGPGGTLELRRSAASGTGVLSDGALARLPFGATIATAFLARPSELLELLEAAEPGSARELELELGQATGVDLSALLADLGPSVGAFATSAGSRGGSPAGPAALVLFLETARPVEVSRALAALVDGLCEAGGERVEARGFEHAGVACTALDFAGLAAPLEPCFAVAGGALYLAGHPDALREALDQLSAERSLLQHPRVAAAPGGDHAGDLCSFTFFDTPRFLNAGYARVARLVPMIEGLEGSGRSGHGAAPLLPALPELAAGSRAWVGRSWLEGGELVRVASFDRSVTAWLVAFAGSPLFESAGVGASLAIPSLLAARIRANERAAVSSLRAIAAAQARFAEARRVDVDGDGRGEYGYLGELTGARPPRGGPVEAARPLEPLLTRRLSPLDDRGQGVATAGGYAFQVFLGTRQRNTVVGVPESMAAGHASSPNADGAARYWCAYAWPLEQGRTGVRAFAIDQDGELRFLYSSPYSGLASEGGRVPRYDAAYDRAGDMTSAFAAGRPAADGNHWTPELTAR